jgi:hypothetical protein
MYLEQVHAPTVLPFPSLPPISRVSTVLKNVLYIFKSPFRKIVQHSSVMHACNPRYLRLRQEDCKFKGSLDKLARLSCKIK